MPKPKVRELSGKETNVGPSKPSRGKAKAVRSGRRKNPKLTRDWSLLVKDQDIFDFTNSIPIDRMREFAGRFAAIAQIIRPNKAWVRADSSCVTAGSAGAAVNSSDAEVTQTADDKIRKIETVERESRVKGFRLIIAAIKQGLEDERDWNAYQTALAVVAELFHHTGGYFRAFDEFCASVLARKKV